jgi:hypothetical protein
MSLSIVFERMLGNTKASLPVANGIICFNISSAGPDKGMRCSRLAFILAAGIVQIFFSRSNSS